MTTERNHFFESSVWLDTDCKEYPLQGVGLEGGMEGLQHLGWGWLCVVPLLLSCALPWSGRGSLGGGPPGLPMLWRVAQICVSVSNPGVRSVAPHTRHCIFIWRNLIYTYLQHRCLDSGVNRYTDVLY
ncbi:hypothetical protein XENOCAPTIV_026978 [Xenoophorus captivus]|uniref:Uncharacterized protein n=1 Tax=Xenoophorus captivus TaxID=1517983 RepID=A0ABV0QK62_9TELE